MIEEPNVTLTVPLTVPLSLATAIHNEAVRRNMSIPDLLSAHIIEAAEERERQEMEQAAHEHINNGAPFSNGSIATVDAESFLPPVGRTT